MLQSMRSAARYVWVLLIVFFIGGFLLYDTSGLIGRDQVTTGTAVGRVNGDEITYAQWIEATRNLAQQEEARFGRSLTLDELQRVEDEAFEQLVTETLLEQEIRRRGITVTDQEIRDAARYSPPPQFLQHPDLQTEGRFDPEKYQRFLASPAARQQGVLFGLEQYYRREIPRQKLFERVTADAFASDAQLWRMWQDQRDSSQISFVEFAAAQVPDDSVTVADAEVRAFYQRYRTRFQRPGRAVVSLVAVPRTITAADTAASRERALALREEIVSGTTPFEDVARRESADTLSGTEGGSLGRTTLDRFVPEFSNAARALPVGQVSQPVESQFGFHLIRVDARAGDTLDLRHILVPIQQSDTSAVETDRLADRLAAVAANSDRGARLDSAARSLDLPVTQHPLTQNDILVVNGVYVPDVSAWAFGGARAGETSDLIAADEAYYVARLDTLVRGGQQRLEDVRDDIRQELALEKKVEHLMPRARQLSQNAAASTLENAAQAAGHPVQRTEPFTRAGGSPLLGNAGRVVGAAFGLPVGAVSAPVAAQEGVYVIRVDRRVPADSTAWAAQRDVQRFQFSQMARRQQLQQFVSNLRQAAEITDRRAEVRTAGRATDF